jgi:hypothetical protein
MIPTGNGALDQVLLDLDAHTDIESVYTSHDAVPVRPQDLAEQCDDMLHALDLEEAVSAAVYALVRQGQTMSARLFAIPGCVRCERDLSCAD